MIETNLHCSMKTLFSKCDCGNKLQLKAIFFSVHCVHFLTYTPAFLDLYGSEELINSGQGRGVSNGPYLTTQLFESAPDYIKQLI